MGKRRWAKHERPVQDRLWEKVTKGTPEACWLWNGSGKRSRYGKIRWNGKVWQVNRVVYSLAFGDIPEGHEVCHHCDNTKCCNPSHLFTGTHQANMDDMVRKGRQGALGKPGRWKDVPRDKFPATIYSTKFVRTLKSEFVPYKVTAKDLSEKYGIPYASARGLIYSTPNI